MSESNGGVPGNLEWDPLNPPMKNDCTGLVGVHESNCDGECDTFPCTEAETALMNENREWARLGMSVRKDPVSLFQLSCRFNAMVEVISEIVGQEKLDEAYQRLTTERMRSIRLANQDAVKRASLGLPPKPGILGPDGEPL